MTPLEPTKPVTIMRPVSYSFRFKQSGWAIFTLNDDTGEFAIQSDWGNYTNRWNVSALGGDKLHAFLAQCEPDYIAGKFESESRGLKPVLDPDATKKSFREYICRDRRSGDLNKEAARDLWDAVDRWHANGFEYHETPDEIHDYFDIASDYFQYRKPHRYDFLVKVLLPFFQAYLKTSVLPSASSAAPSPPP